MGRRTLRRSTTRRCLQRSPRRSRVASTPSPVAGRSERRIVDSGGRRGRTAPRAPGRSADWRLVVRRSRVSLGDDGHGADHSDPSAARSPSRSSRAGWPALRRFGWDFFIASDWDAVKGKFGAAPAVFGTIVSSIIALLIATPLAVGVAIFLSEFAPRWLRQPVAFLVDLLAAIPSVVYGLWGVLVLLPFLRESRDAVREGHAAPRRTSRCSPVRRTDRACSRRDRSWRSWCCRTSPP